MSYPPGPPQPPFRPGVAVPGGRSEPVLTPAAPPPAEPVTGAPLRTRAAVAVVVIALALGVGVVVTGRIAAFDPVGFVDQAEAQGDRLLTERTSPLEDECSAERNAILALVQEFRVQNGRAPQSIDELGVRARSYMLVVDDSDVSIEAVEGGPCEGVRTTSLLDIGFVPSTHHLVQRYRSEAVSHDLGGLWTPLGLLQALVVVAAVAAGSWWLRAAYQRVPPRDRSVPLARAWRPLIVGAVGLATAVLAYTLTRGMSPGWFRTQVVVGAVAVAGLVWLATLRRAAQMVGEVAFAATGRSSSAHLVALALRVAMVVLVVAAVFTATVAAEGDPAQARAQWTAYLLLAAIGVGVAVASVVSITATTRAVPEEIS